MEQNSPPPSDTSAPKWEFWQDDEGKWRWKRVGENGETTTASEGYAMRVEAVNAARMVGYPGY
jgi:uncharacterized protein YegP (UPF0339 family)